MLLGLSFVNKDDEDILQVGDYEKVVVNSQSSSEIVSEISEVILKNDERIIGVKYGRRESKLNKIYDL